MDSAVLFGGQDKMSLGKKIGIVLGIFIVFIIILIVTGVIDLSSKPAPVVSAAPTEPAVDTADQAALEPASEVPAPIPEVVKQLPPPVPIPEVAKPVPIADAPVRQAPPPPPEPVKPTDPCSSFTDSSTGISKECYAKIWKDAGCLTNLYSDDGQYNWAVKQTVGGLKADSAAWASMLDQNHRKGCYGDDKSKWPAIKWSDLKKKMGAPIDWAASTYDAMVGDPIGTRKAPYEGGIGAISGQFWGQELTKANADGACENPCYWYYNHPNATAESKSKIDKAGLCDCSIGKAKNF